MNEAFLETALSFDPVLSERGVTYLPDGRCRIQLEAGEAKTVVLSVDFQDYPLEPDGDGLWSVTLRLEPGFRYLFLRVDGADLLHPALPIGYGYSRPINYLNVPTGDDDWYLCQPVPHGAVAQDYYPSSVTGRTERCLVYLPPSYFQGDRSYPVLYLQHGHGENETGWLHQGKLNFILDNLIAAGQAKEMLVVMANGMVQVDGKVDSNRFPALLVNDLIPYVEGRYRISSRREERAMAGLSMGSWQTSAAAFTHPELFSQIGLFSGFLRDLFGGENPHLAALDDPAAFRAHFPLFFRAMGETDQFFHIFQEDDQILADKGVDSDRRVYRGPHVWQVWRECARDFLPLLFRL